MLGVWKILTAAALIRNGVACDVSYDFGSQKNAIATQLQATLTWWQVTPMDRANVYLSTATGTACNSGYFGAQFHSDGSTTLLFSMWDSPANFSHNPEFVFQSLPGNSNCHRNALDSSGKSTGTQCAPHLGGEKVNLELGVPYVFTFGIVAQNASGAMWEVSMFDTKHESTISVGKIFFVDEPMGLPKTCRTLGYSQNPPTSGLASYTFMEYFAQPRDYLSAASWSDMKISAPWSQGMSADPRLVNYVKLGDGGCSSETHTSSIRHSGIASEAECRTLCTDNVACGAYDYCNGSNCVGNCNIWPHNVSYTDVVGYPTVECYTKQALVRPQGIEGECCDHGDYKHGDHVNGTSSTCIPPECDSPDIHFMMGPSLMVPDKILAENPMCLGSTSLASSRNRNVGHKCWDSQIPDSLEECWQAPSVGAVVV